MPPVAATHSPDPATAIGPAPDRRFEVVAADGRVEARCALWWRPPSSPAEPATALVGSYSAESATAGAAVLARAEEAARAHECARMIGPVDGTTWGTYRFVTGGSQGPPFFLEPRHPPSWPDHFRTAGFVPWTRYQSSVVELNDHPPTMDSRPGADCQTRGIRIRSLEQAEISGTLPAIHRISLAAFAQAPLYQPIDFDAFAALHAAMLPRLVPELVLIAERAGQALGFLFAIPDFLQAANGGRIDTVIIKTVAAWPGRAQAGLGGALVRHLHARAREHGFSRVIHALMHESNSSRNILRPHPTLLRQYTLFAKSL